MNLVISENAWLDLKEIWSYNAGRYGREHAVNYQAFLVSEMASLVDHPSKGKRVPRDSAMRYLVMKRRSGGHGHSAYYVVNENTVYIVRVLHTAMHAPDHIRGT